MDKIRFVKRRIVPVAVILLILLVSLSIYVFLKGGDNRIEQLQAYGYFGVFLVSFLLNATVIIPVGNIVPIAMFGATLSSPLLVGIIGGFGAAFGESLAYFLGSSGREILEEKRFHKKAAGWVERWGIWAVLIGSALPLAFDIIGIAAGALKMRFWKFFIAAFAGRAVLYTIVAIASSRAWIALQPIF